MPKHGDKFAVAALLLTEFAFELTSCKSLTVAKDPKMSRGQVSQVVLARSTRRTHTPSRNTVTGSKIFFKARGTYSGQLDAIAIVFVCVYVRVWTVGFEEW